MSKTSAEFSIPTVQEIEEARKAFRANEPRDLFYRVAIELLDLAADGKTQFRAAEALAVLLQTWNKRYYNKHHPFDKKHFSDIEELVRKHEQTIASFKKRSIASFSAEDEELVKTIFKSFDKVVGTVGAAKSLHLLAPHFFPIWDRAIAQHYKLALIYGTANNKYDDNAQRYYQFME